jgi:hypothetical protein
MKSKFPFVSGQLIWQTPEDMYLHYYNQCERKPYPEYPIGGQSCGMPIRGVRLIHYDLGFEVAVCCHRSQIKNNELALIFFKLFIDEVILPQL